MRSWLAEVVVTLKKFSKFTRKPPPTLTWIRVYEMRYKYKRTREHSSQVHLGVLKKDWRASGPRFPLTAHPQWILNKILLPVKMKIIIHIMQKGRREVKARRWELRVYFITGMHTCVWSTQRVKCIRLVLPETTPTRGNACGSNWIWKLKKKRNFTLKTNSSLDNFLHYDMTKRRWEISLARIYETLERLTVSHAKVFLFSSSSCSAWVYLCNSSPPLPKTNRSTVYTIINLGIIQVKVFLSSHDPSSSIFINDKSFPFSEAQKLSIRGCYLLSTFSSHALPPFPQPNFFRALISFTCGIVRFSPKFI